MGEAGPMCMTQNGGAISPAKSRMREVTWKFGSPSSASELPQVVKSPRHFPNSYQTPYDSERSGHNV